MNMEDSGPIEEPEWLSLRREEEAAAGVTQIRQLAVSRGRMPPQDLDAERSLLCGILLDPAALDSIADLGAQDFRREANRKVYEAMLALRKDGRPIDRVTVKDELRRRGHAEIASDDGAVDELDGLVPSASNLPYYAKIVREKADARRIIEAGQAIAAQGYEQHGSAAEYLADSVRRLGDIARLGTAKAPHESVDEFLAREFPPEEWLDRDAEHPLMAAQSITAIQGMPGAGKTLLALAIVCAAAAAGKRCLVIESEGSGPGMQRRLRRAIAVHGKVTGEVRIWFRPRDFSLARKADADRLVAMARGFDLVMLDSLSALAGDADENDAKEWREVNEAIARVRDEAGAAPLYLHHLIKSAWGKGARAALANGRGSGVAQGRADAVIEVTPAPRQMGGVVRFTITFVKQPRDGEPRAPLDVEVTMTGDIASVEMAPHEEPTKDVEPSIDGLILDALPDNGPGLGADSIASRIGKRAAVVRESCKHLFATNQIRKGDGSSRAGWVRSSRSSDLVPDAHSTSSRTSRAGSTDGDERTDGGASDAA